MSNRSLHSILTRFGRLLLLVTLSRNLLLWLAATSALAVVLCVAAHCHLSPVWLPSLGLVSALALAAATAAALLPRRHATRVARTIESHYPALQESLLTAVRLSGDDRAYSRQLTEAVVVQAQEALALIPPGSVLDLHRLRPLVIAAAVALLLASASLFASRDALATMLEQRVELPAVVPRLLPQPPPLPLVSGVRLHIQPPAYTGLPARTITTRFAALRAPAGSMVVLSASTPAVGSLALNLNDQPAALAAIPPRQLGREFRLTRETRWELTNAAGERRHRLAGLLRPVTDLPPTVIINYPGKDQTVKEIRPLKLLGKAYDDYGLRTLALEYAVTSAGSAASPGRSEGHKPPPHSSWHRLQLGATGRMSLVDYEWDLSPLNLQPGQTMHYRLAAQDNNLFAGPRTGYSKTYRLTLAALAPQEAAKRVEQAREQQEETLQRLREQAQDLQRKLEELQQKLAQGEELAPAERAELEQAAQQLQKQGEDLQAAAAQVRQDLQQPGVSSELARRMAEVQKLLDETVSKQLRQAVEKLQQAAQAREPEQAQQSLEEAQEAQKELMERLEQLLGLMKQAKLEGDLAAMRQELEKLAARQQELIQRRQTEANLRDQARDQKQLARETEEAVQKAEALAERTAAEDAKTGEKVAEAAEALRQADPSGRMQAASQSLQAQQSKAAAAPQQQALQALQQAAASLAEAQAGVYSDMRQELQQAAGQLVQQALYLSEQQERLRKDVSPFAERMPEQTMQQKAKLERLAQRQQSVTRGATRMAQRLAELAQKSPLVELGLALQAAGVAQRSAQAEREVAGGAMGEAPYTQEEVISGLNQLAQKLLGADQQFQQASAQMAMQEYMKRLEAMAKQQQALNQMTQQAGGGMPMPMPGGQPGPMPGASGLAGQQGAIRQALQQMLGQAGQQSGLGQQLGGLPAEMNEVEQDLRGQNLGRQTYRRQADILHKMLDAQRSLYQRDREERKRLAEAPKPYKRPASPPALRQNTTPRPVQPAGQPSQQDLPLGYEDLTRAYLRSLR